MVPPPHAGADPRCRYVLSRGAGGTTRVTAPARVNIRSRCHQTTTAATATRIQVSHGCASGQNGFISCQWNSIGNRRLPRPAFRIGVTRIARVTFPMKKGRKLQFS